MVCDETSLIPDTLFRDPRFDALRNALYHTQRRNFLDRWNRSLTFLVIVLGTGVVGKIASRLNFPAEWCLELGVVFFATVQLVSDLGPLARNHEFLQRRYYELLAEIETKSSASADDKRKWSARLLAIAGEEPIAMRDLDAVAYNSALDALYDDPKIQKIFRQHVKWWQYFLRHWYAFPGTNFHSHAGQSEIT